MSDRQFLPESENDYSIPKRDPSGFTDGDANLLKDIGKKMNVNLAQSEGRVPSPFSRAYLFYLNLFATGLGGSDSLKKDIGRDLLQEKARRTFRGLLATFALRHALGLSVELQTVNIDSDGEPVETLLHPATQSAPRGSSYWNPIRLYTVRRGSNYPREVLAGQSPLTGLFPAATPPESLNSLYWYDAEDGSWYDPTSTELTQGDDTLPVSVETQEIVKGLLKSWLEEATEIIDSEGLEEHGLNTKDTSLLKRELEEWRAQIDAPADERELVREPIRSEGATNVNALPFLHVACPDPAESITSDLPVHDGRLLVRAQDLTNSKTRLFGRVTGSTSFESNVADLDREGQNLGRDLGLDSDAMPRPYLYVNELFAPKLTPLTSKGFSEEWDGIEIEGEHYLLPFHPDILNLLTPRELVESTSAERTFDDKYRITLDYGEGAPVEKKYVEKADADDGEYVVDAETIPPERFDLRLFPNFSLENTGDLLKEDDQKYYARVRLAPTWDFDIHPLHHDRAEGVTIGGDDTHPVEKTQIGNFEETVPGDRLSRGEALFITCADEPDGFYVEGHGLCIVDLRVPSEPRKSWQVGVDFGTSNTCVSYRPNNPAGDDSPQVMDLPVFTTTLFKEPSLNAEFENPHGSTVDERASALLDFFYRQSQSDETLNTRSYFPTQFITRLSEMDPSPDWDFETGLIYFRNIGIGGAIDVQELIEGYPDITGGDVRRPKRDFKAKQDLKWENTQWMEAFMRHLRKHVVLKAAYKNAKITDLKFSYPKAFTTNDRSRFRNVLTRAWGNLVEDEAQSDAEAEQSTSLQLCSESEAVRNRFVKKTGEYIVLDIGGGTTDVIAFHDDQPILQTSYRVAAGLINDYVAAAPAFRRAFLQAMQKVLQKRYEQELPDPLEKKFVEKGGDESVVKTIWIGLLNLIEQEDPSLQQVLHELRDPKSDEIVTDEATEKAVRGFFLSVALLFTGSAFNAGILLHAASQGVLTDGRDGFDPEFVDLELTGNGAKLLRMLHESEQPFDPVLREALYQGIQAVGDQAPGFEPDDVGFKGVDRSDGVSPKVSVSLGLLENNVFGTGDDQGSDEVPLANIVAERGLEAIEGAGENLVSFYEDAHQNGFSSPEQAPDILETYLDALGEMLPKGNNRGAMVLPRVGANWHAFVRDEIYSDSRRVIDTRVKQNADQLAKQRKNLSEDDLPALESLFVVELRALIEQVRETYAQ